MNDRDNQASGATLREVMLLTESSDELKRRARLIPGRSPTNKSDLAEYVDAGMQGDSLRAMWEHLEPLEKLAVAEAVHSPHCSRYSRRKMLAKYGAAPALETHKVYHWTRKDDRVLMLFFVRGVMPEDLRHRLRDLVPPPPAAMLPTCEELPARIVGAKEAVFDPEQRSSTPIPLELTPVVHASEARAVRELRGVLRLVQAGRVEVNARNSRPTASGQREVGALLEGGDFYPASPAKSAEKFAKVGPIRAFAWPMLLQFGDLAELEGAYLRLTHKGMEALAGDTALVLRELWDRWLVQLTLDEVTRLDYVKTSSEWDESYFSRLQVRRQSLERALQACPVGPWIALGDFVRHADALDLPIHPTHAHSQVALKGGYWFESGSELLSCIDHAFVAELVLEYAATLGVVDVALVPPDGFAFANLKPAYAMGTLPYLSRYDGLAYFRITPLGAWILGLARAHTPAVAHAPEGLSVMPNLEIVSMGQEVDAADRVMLDAYATRVQDRVWRVESGGLLAAMDKGRSIQEFRAFLQGRTATGLPETLVHLLADVEERATMVEEAGAAQLLLCANASLALLIANDPRTAKFCLRAGERHLAVFEGSMTPFRRKLREMGYLVAKGALVPEPPAKPLAPSGRGRRRR